MLKTETCYDPVSMYTQTGRCPKTHVINDFRLQWNLHCISSMRWNFWILFSMKLSKKKVLIGFIMGFTCVTLLIPLLLLVNLVRSNFGASLTTSKAFITVHWRREESKREKQSKNEKEKRNLCKEKNLSYNMKEIEKSVIGLAMTNMKEKKFYSRKSL